jgi:Protein involved in cellulose biosynthesis (CelD)
MTLAGALSETEDEAAKSAKALSLGLRGSVARTRDALEALAPRWRELERLSEGDGLFQSLGWARAVFEFEAARNNAGFDPVIAVVEQGERLAGVLPLERIRTGFRTLLVPLGHAYAQISDALVAPGIDPAAAVASLIGIATQEAPCDGVSLLKVRSGSVLALGMPGTHIRTGEEQGAPYVALDAFADFASYFATVRTKTRKNMRNARNRLEREGPVEHRVVDQPAEQQALIERTLDGRADRLKQQGLTSRAFSDGGFVEFCRLLVGREDMNLMGFSLTHNGKPLAEQWGFVHGGRYHAFVASRDFSHSDESPGKLHLAEILAVCADRGLKGCDLGVPVMPYKLTFATETIALHDYALPVTPRGWMMIQLWDVWLRPSLKRLVLALPPPVRAGLMRLLGRAPRGEARDNHG